MRYRLRGHSSRNLVLANARINRIMTICPLVRPLSVLRWGLVSILVVLLGYLSLLRPWHLHWGATAEEVNRAMPGDDIIPDPGLNTTRAITIRATPEEIWPWLVQMGYGRAGWYSYDRLDNGGRPSADRIVPALQNPPKIGQRLPGGPEKAFTVMSFEPNRSLVLGPAISWSFGLYPQPDGTTRLVERLRAKYWWTRPRMYLMTSRSTSAQGPD